jgi:hypothetical protein
MILMETDTKVESERPNAVLVDNDAVLFESDEVLFDKFDVDTFFADNIFVISSSLRDEEVIMLQLPIATDMPVLFA